MSSTGAVIDTSYITPRVILPVTIVLTVISIVSVSLRFYVRRIQSAPILSDDWLLIPGLLCTIAIAISLFIGIAGHGVGYDKGLPPNSPPEAQLTYLAPNVVLTEKVGYAVQLMQIVGLGFTKASIIMFYRRIFCTGHRTWFWHITIVILVLIALWTIVFFFLFVFLCGTNPWAEWHRVVDLIQYCPNGNAYQGGLGISDFLMDIIVLLLPIPIIVRLHTDVKRKLLIILVFMLGLVAIAASATRMVIFVLQMRTGFNLKEDGDKIVALMLFWSMVENGAAIVAACLPTLRYLLGKGPLMDLIKSIRSRLSLHSLRTRRSTQNNTDSESLQNITESEMQHLDRIRGQGTVENNVERTDSGDDQTYGSGINVKRSITQREEQV